MIKESPFLSSPLCGFHSFGNITPRQAEIILSKNRVKPGHFLLWYCEEENCHAISCINAYNRFIHIPVDTRKYSPLISKVSGVEEKRLKQLDPVNYHYPIILNRNIRAKKKKHLLEPHVLKKVLKAAATFVEPGLGILIQKTHVPQLNDRKVVVIMGSKLRLYELFDQKDKRIGKGTCCSIYSARSLRSGKMRAEKRFKQKLDYSLINPHLEDSVLKKIHAERIVPGIQKPFQASVKISYGSGKERHSHFGYLYKGDLFDNTIKNKSSVIPNDPKKILKAFLVVFKGILHCHNIKVIHNDIKLENLFFSNSKGTFKIFLGDFGLAYDFDALPYDIDVPGTKGIYPVSDLAMMIKAIKEKDYQTLYEVGSKRDVFSVAVACYGALTNNSPFFHDSKGYPYGEYGWELFEEAMYSKYKVEPLITDEINQLFQKMLNFNLEKRLSMKEAVDNLKEIITSWDQLEAAEKAAALERTNLTKAKDFRHSI